MVNIVVRRVRMPEEADVVGRFLCEHTWPFHRTPAPTTAEARSVPIAGGGVESHWVLSDDTTVGLIRLLDLDDIPEGSPLFDLRIAEQHRGRGIGTAAVSWLTSHLFDRYPELHRIEAATRDDNDAIHRVLQRCGYVAEGRLRESWQRADGSRADTVIYGILRTDPR